MSSHLDTAVEVWALFAVNFLGFLLGALITTLSYLAYRSSDGKTALRNATVGFALLTIGTAVEPIYQLGIERSHVLASDQNIMLQLTEGVVISLGFLVLFFSIYRYSRYSTRQTVTVSGIDDDLFGDSD